MTNSWLLVPTFVMLTGCGHSPTSPATNASQPAPAQPAPAITSIRVDGPTQVAPGSTADYTATAQFSDGTSRDITATALWSPTPDRTWFPLRFNGPGKAIASDRGEVVVSAAAENKVGSLNVLILEPGTFKLSGVVSEAGGRTLTDATVQVVAGTGMGLTSSTARGTYALYGVAGAIRVRASADGFSSQIHEVGVDGQNTTHGFALAPLQAPADVSGRWTMTIVASPACGSNTPDFAKNRDYHVELGQRGTGLRITFTDPTLTVYSPDSMEGTVFGSHVGLVFPGDTGYERWSLPNIFDRLSPTEQFGFDGAVEASVIGSQMIGRLSGDLTYWQTNLFDPAWYCRATDHPVVFRR